MPKRIRIHHPVTIASFPIHSQIFAHTRSLWADGQSPDMTVCRDRIPAEQKLISEKRSLFLALLRLHPLLEFLCYRSRKVMVCSRCSHTGNETSLSRNSREVEIALLFISGIVHKNAFSFPCFAILIFRDASSVIASAIFLPSRSDSVNGRCFQRIFPSVSSCLIAVQPSGAITVTSAPKSASTDARRRRDLSCTHDQNISTIQVKEQRKICRRCL